jgi:dTDP-4-amino-4,6-dideoxygalactose transaminase
MSSPKIRDAQIRFPVFRPALPTVDKFSSYIAEIDQNRWYTNHGPLVERFEMGLARHFGVTAGQIVTSSNATVALSQTLRSFDIRPGSLCVMPSWTFAATAAAALWAGMEPYFLDVEAESWLITPERIKALAKKRAIGAVIVVSAFGAPLDVKPWDEFTRETGIPVVIDAAAGFDSFTRQRIGEVSTPIAISLHATKVSGIGEGAAVIASDTKFISKIRAYGNFGFMGTREALVPGFNAKMTEYSAAIGLAMLNEWPVRRAEWQLLTDHFAALVKTIPNLQCAPGFGEGWISSYGLIQLPADLSAEDFSGKLHERGIETRQWWGKGCHLQEAYCGYGHDHLRITDVLTRRVLGLPFWLGLQKTELEEIFSELTDLMRTG